MSVTIPSLPECVSEPPFVTLGTGTAPALNYNLPQKAAFSTYSAIPIPIDPSWFTDAANAVPALLSFDQAKEMILELVIYPNQAIPAALTMLSPTSLATLRSYYAQALLQNSVANIIDFIANHAYDTTYGPSIDHTALLNNYINYLANLAIDDQKAAVALSNFGGYDQNIHLFNRPSTPTPTLFLVEEYQTESYLGDYGAGETVNTFSLLPGEKTTISIQTFKSSTDTQNYSDSVIDSLSTSSAANFQQELDNQFQYGSVDTTVTNSSDSSGGGVNLIFFSFGGGSSSNTTTTSTRTSNVNLVSKAVENHVNSANSNRSVNVNSNTTQSTTNTEEQDIERELVNPNVSRVLNFVFRQLVQEYVCITHLDTVRVGFTNGNPESFVIVSIEQLSTLLSKYIASAHQADVEAMIWNEYQNIKDYTGATKTFLEEATAIEWDGTTTTTFLTKVVPPAGTTDTALINTYTYQSLSGPVVIPIDGPILKVDKHILRTDSLITDALMGQGEALDCFNAHAQDAKTQALYIQNNQAQLDQARVQLALDTLNAITDPVQRAQQYAAIFNPQVQNIIE